MITANLLSLPRDQLFKALNDPRVVIHFEKLAEQTVANTETLATSVSDTQQLKDAAFVTLSANAELPNERVLSFGAGVKGEIGAGTVRIGLDRNVPQATGGFSVTLVAAGDSRLGLPPAGNLATQEWASQHVRGLVPAAAGAPGYTPSPPAGFLATYYDTTNNDFYVYNGAWKKVALT